MPSLKGKKRYIMAAGAALAAAAYALGWIDAATFASVMSHLVGG